MGVLIINEIRKILFKKKTWVITIGFALLLSLMAFSMYKNQEYSKINNSPAQQKLMMENELKNLKDQENEANIPDTKKQAIQMQISDLEEQLKNVQSNKAPIDWKEQLRKEKQQNLDTLKNQVIQQDEHDRIIIRNNEIDYRLNHNIKPIEEYMLTAYSFFINIIGILSAVFIMMGILVFGADIVSGEFTPPTMKVLLTQPVSRSKVILSKYLSLVITSVVLILFTEGIAFLVIGMIFGFGNMMDPVTIGTRYMYNKLPTDFNGSLTVMVAGTSHIVPAYQYALMNFGFEVLYIVACVSFTFLLSCIFRSSMISVVFGVVVSIASLVIEYTTVIRKVLPYVFFYLGNSTLIITGNFAQNFNSPNATISNSIIVLIISSIIFYAISHIIFIKRDILI